MMELVGDSDWLPAMYYDLSCGTRNIEVSNKSAISLPDY